APVARWPASSRPGPGTGRRAGCDGNEALAAWDTGRWIGEAASCQTCALDTGRHVQPVGTKACIRVAWRAAPPIIAAMDDVATFLRDRLGLAAPVDVAVTRGAV